MEKNEFNKFVEKYQPVVKKTGEQLSKVLKTAENDLSKMYKLAQTHVELQLKNLQKEKLYHDLGKYIAGELLKESFNPKLDQYKKQLIKMNSDGEKMKRKLSGINKTAKKKSSAKK